MANELIQTNAAALAALVDKTTGDTLTAAEYTTLKDSLQEANTATRTANTVFAGPASGSPAVATFRALVSADIPMLTVAKISDIGAAATRAVGVAIGNLIEVGGDGKISASVLPNIAITSVQVVASQVAMLALTAEPGDVAVRSDINRSFILSAAPASTLANWTELLTPTDAVLSVAGRTGAVVLAAADIVSGVLDPARLGTGTADDTTVLYGDGVWREPAGGGAGPVFTTQVQFIDGTMSAPGATFGGTTEGWCHRSPGILSYVIGSHVVMEYAGTIMQVGLNGGVHWCAGPPEETPWDTGIECAAAGVALKATKNGGNGYAQVRMDSLGVANSAAATTPGTVTKKVEIFSEAGASLGFVPVYDAIT